MSKKLVAYFSASGTTARVADNLAKAAGADLYEIKPAVSYTKEDLNWMNKQSRSSVEMRDKSSRPALADTDADIAAYDTIFIGYPIWWYELPMIMQTFFDTYDLSGKTIIPFNTHEGSGDSGTYDQIKTEEPNATVLEGLPIRGGDIENSDSKDKVTEWLTGLGY